MSLSVHCECALVDLSSVCNWHSNHASPIGSKTGHGVQARALCVLDTAWVLAGTPARVPVSKPAPGAPFATPFDTLRTAPCAKAAPEDQSTPLATWPSESDGSEWLASAASAEARAELPPGAGKAVAVQGKHLPRHGPHRVSRHVCGPCIDSYTNG